MNPPQKNRANTEQKILNAVEYLLLHQGFPSVGINPVARQAGCDKVLIYRYFSGMDGLLEQFANSRNLWWSADEIITQVKNTELSLPAYLEQLLKVHIQSLQSRPLTLEIMAWEMSASNPLINALHRERSEQGMSLVKQVRQRYHQPNIDIGGILGIFGTAINHLVVRTRHRQSEHAREEWWRLEQTINSLLQCSSIRE